MKLGVNVGYWGLGLSGPEQLEIVQEAERLGYDSVWAAEAYGSDAATVLAWLAGGTSTIKLGSAIFQIPAPQPGDDGDDGRHASTRSPAGGFSWASAPSGPQVSEGWHGVRFGRQLLRTREYVGGRAQGARARTRWSSTARRSTCPLPDGPGKALKLTIAPGPGAHPDLPGGDRPEEHGAGRRDRRRLDPDALLPRARRRVQAAARGGRGDVRALAGAASTSRRP